MIDYDKIAKAINYYQNNGFEYIDVPWLISKETIDITRPKNCRDFNTFLGNLVASGEQSFLEIRNNLIPNNLYQCVTPCFRDDCYDDLHQPYFLKVELIHAQPKNASAAFNEILKIASDFFKIFSDISIIETEIGKDILINGIEVGSYGIREYQNFTWIFGTGLAEPRLTQALLSIP